MFVDRNVFYCAAVSIRLDNNIIINKRSVGSLKLIINLLRGTDEDNIQPVPIHRKGHVPDRAQ